MTGHEAFWAAVGFWLFVGSIWVGYRAALYEHRYRTSDRPNHGR